MTRTGRSLARKHGTDAGSRERILASALEIFAERGFDGATTREIAARAGVNLGLITYYFENKEKLWRAAVDHVFAALWSMLEEVSADWSKPDAVAGLLRAAVHFAAGHPAFVRLMNDEGKRPGPRLRWLVERHTRRMFEVGIDVLEHGRAAKVVPDVPAVHLYYMLLGAIGLIFSQAPEYRRYTGDDPTTSEALVDAHAEAVVRVFLRR